MQQSTYSSINILKKPHKCGEGPSVSITLLVGICGWFYGDGGGGVDGGRTSGEDLVLRASIYGKEYTNFKVR